MALGGRHILARAQENGILVRWLIDRIQARSDGSALHTGQQTTAVSPHRQIGRIQDYRQTSTTFFLKMLSIQFNKILHILPLKLLLKM